MKLPQHGRYNYRAIHDRPDYRWPNGTRLAVYFCLNVEYFAFGVGHGSDGATGVAPQTQRNYAWRDYGNRVGIWRLFDLLDELGAPAGHNLNSLVLDHHPDIGERIRARGDEMIGHGRSNAERQTEYFEEDEARAIAECTAALTRAGGRAPAGWLTPWIAESRVTADLLKEAGYRYIMDWPADDQPFWLRTRSGPILNVPYPIEVNDSPALVFRQHTARQFVELIVDQFDEMLDQSRKQSLVCGIALHTFVVGQPFRLRALRDALRHVIAHRGDIWLTTPGAIAEHCLTLPAGTIPGP